MRELRKDKATNEQRKKLRKSPKYRETSIREERKKSQRAKAPSLPTIQSLHLPENGKPRIGPEMATPIFIQTMPRSSVFFGNPEAFAETDVEVEGSPFFSVHGVEDLGILPVDGLVTLLFVGHEAGVAPLLRHVGLLVLL